MIKQSEDNIQIMVINWAKGIKYKDKTLADYIHHSPNGGARNPREGAKFKRMGVQAGYPDLIIDIANNGYHGLRIELKTKKGTVRANQKQRLQMLNDEGYLAIVCKGFDEAITAIKNYMGLRDGKME